jgi:hypothetical protein
MWTANHRINSEEKLQVQPLQKVMGETVAASYESVIVMKVWG